MQEEELAFEIIPLYSSGLYINTAYYYTEGVEFWVDEFFLDMTLSKIYLN